MDDQLETLTLDTADAGRHALEMLIDEISSESFPASDPPVVGRRRCAAPVSDAPFRRH